MTEHFLNTVAKQSSRATSKVHILDPCTSHEWMQFINTHPGAGIFHHPEWMKLLRDVYGYRIFAVCLKDGEKIRAGIPFADVHSVLTGKRWISLPFSDYCEPLLCIDEPQCAEDLVRFLKKQQGVETPKIEIHWDLHSTQGVFTAHNFFLHTVPLEKDYDAVFKRMDKQSVRNRIAKAEREGVVVRECKTQEEFDDFYALQVLTRKRLGVPAQPKYFFDAVWNYIITSGLGFALIAYKDEKPIGGGVFFKYGSTVCYKYGASDFAYKGIHPTHAYIWQGIRRACMEGFRQFDFGRSDVNNNGLRVFKSGWGTVEHPLGYTIISDVAPRIGASKLDGITSYVIRNSPAFVCKLSGQLLYKHFA